MGHRNYHSIHTTFVLVSSIAVFGQIGSAKAQPATEGSPKVDEAATTAPAAEPTDKAAAPAADATTTPPPATPKCECPPPCPAPPPEQPAPAVPAVEWKVQSKGGMMFTSGNAQSKNFTFGVNGFRKEGNNKVSLEGGIAYGTSSVLTYKQDGTYDREQTTTNNNMAAKGRYDRFLTEQNAAYASAQAASDKIAGKTFFGGGQLGYSRLLRKDNWNLVVAELGYDFSYERYVEPAAPAAALDPVTIHSARILVGETLSLSKETGITVSVEALFNLNREAKAVNAKSKDGSLGVDAFKDTRVNAKLGLSTNLWKSLSFGFSFILKYDQNPAPRPVPRGAPSTFSFAKDSSDYYSDKVDTITEATLIYTFF